MPDETGAVLQISVNPDQTKLLRDTLHVIINEGDDLMFPTTAVGAGQLVTCDQSSTGVDFGPQFIGALLLNHFDHVRLTNKSPMRAADADFATLARAASS